MARSRNVQAGARRRADAPSLRTRRAAPGSDRPLRLRLTVDQALIALLIAAMDANGHVSRDELARAHHIIWSMRRYRRKSGEHVGRLIDDMRDAIETHGALAVISASSRVIPARLRPAAFAVAADLVLSDGRIDSSERRFMNRLGAELALERPGTDAILDVMLVKNSA